MKRFLSGVFVVTTLLAASACSLFTKCTEVELSPSMMMNHDQDSRGGHEGHSMKNMNHENNSQTTTQATLNAPKTLTPNQSVNLVIDIQDATGKPVNKFDIFQEKIMHLIVVKDDLKSFAHLHPEYKENGRFQVTANFPESGNYTLFSDYKPAGKKENVSLMNMTIPGSVSSPRDLEKFTKTKTLTDTKVNLNISEKNLQAGKEISLNFDLKDNKNQPIQDLQPYLGEKGHLVIIKSSSPLTKSDYIHAHALKNTPDGKIEFQTKFPQSGTYKMWLQFNRNGNIKTADFWVKVEE